MRSRLIGLAGPALVAVAACTPGVPDEAASAVLVAPPPAASMPVPQGNPAVMLPLTGSARPPRRTRIATLYLARVGKAAGRQRPATAPDEDRNVAIGLQWLDGYLQRPATAPDEDRNTCWNALTGNTSKQRPATAPDEDRNSTSAAR